MFRQFTFREGERGGGGWRILTKVSYGALRLEFQTLTLSRSNFYGKYYPFHVKQKSVSVSYASVMNQRQKNSFYVISEARQEP